MAKKKNQKANEGSDCSMDKKMFTRINALILKDDNYLTPKLSRDFILKRTNVPKNKSLHCSENISASSSQTT